MSFLSKTFCWVNQFNTVCDVIKGWLLAENKNFPFACWGTKFLIVFIFLHNSACLEGNSSVLVRNVNLFSILRRRNLQNRSSSLLLSYRHILSIVKQGLSTFFDLTYLPPCIWKSHKHTHKIWSRPDPRRKQS